MTATTRQSFRRQDGSIDLEKAMKAGRAERDLALAGILKAALRTLRNAEGLSGKKLLGSIVDVSWRAYR